MKKKKTPAQKRKTVKKKATKLSEKASWKKFEEFVSRIEQVLSPKGAIVKSPDFLIDKVTGQKREVDASIRYKIGTSEIIIGIECRDRVKVQDTMWIEQLYTKQQNIGTSKTIAVTANRFTEPAMKKAKQFGIELRKLNRIQDASIDSWITTIRRQINCRMDSWSIQVDAPSETGEKLKDELKQLISAQPHSIYLFDHASNKPVSIKDLFFHFLNRSKKDVDIVDVPATGYTGTYKLNAQVTKGQIYVKSSMGNFDLMGLNVDYRFYVHEETTLVPTVEYTYSDTENELVKGVEFETLSANGEKNLLTVHYDLTENQAIASVWDIEEKNP